MLSIVIPTLNAQDGLARSLPVLARAAVSGTAGQLVVSDGGSRDDTLRLADAAGADIVTGTKGRGAQLAAGAARARGDWLLFLHADTVLSDGWEQAVDLFVDKHRDGRTAAVFRFRLDDASWRARMLEWIVRGRIALFALPYGDQGLLISRTFYDRLGGFSPIPIMEDVDIIRRIGRKRLTVLRHDAVTSARRYQRSGYLRRMARNLMCISLWFAGMPPHRIAGLYHK